MKKMIIVAATVEGVSAFRAGEYISDALEVGLDGGPQEDYDVTDVTVHSDVIDSPEWDDALGVAASFTDERREEFFDRLGNAARSIAEQITEDAAQESDQ